MKGLLNYSNYFMVTVHLGFGFHVIFASVNALYQYSIRNIFDAFNTTFSITVFMLCFLIMCLTWYMTYYMKVPRTHHKIIKSIKDMDKNDMNYTDLFESGKNINDSQ